MTSGAGRVLGGRYTLLTPIAQGGMGEVWKARDRVSGHIVAAKVLRPELTGEELSLSRLRLEARNSMSISHPNIANTQDSGEEDGIGWIIMELVDGYPLTDYLRGGSRIEPEYLMPILVQVAMALGAAARAGVVHRDIKPANIIVRPDGMVKLTDFGISRATGQVNLTAAGMVMGTAQYLPPEQAMGEVATPIGDLYALGVIAYEAAAGRRPFTGETQVDIAFAHVNDPVPPLPDFVPERSQDDWRLRDPSPAAPAEGRAAPRRGAHTRPAVGADRRARASPDTPHAARRDAAAPLGPDPEGARDDGPSRQAARPRRSDDDRPLLGPNPDHGSPRRRPAHPRRGRGPPDLSPRIRSHPDSSPAPRDDRRAGARGVGCRPIANLDRTPRGSLSTRTRCSYARAGRHRPPDHGFSPEARGSRSLRAGPTAQQREGPAPPGLSTRAAPRADPGSPGRHKASTNSSARNPSGSRAAGPTSRPRRATAPA